MRDRADGAQLKEPHRRFQTQYHGMQAVQTAFLVALAQIIPEHRVQLFAGRVKIRVRVSAAASAPGASSPRACEACHRLSAPLC
jgi:hypothetical protein